MSIYVTSPRPYYGAFQDSTTQSIASTTTAYPVKLNTTDYANKVSVVSDGTNLTRVTVENRGIYNIQFSFQLANASASTENDVDIWLRIDGVDVAGSNGQVSIVPSHGGTSGKLLPSWNYVLELMAGQYFQLMWRASSTDVTMPQIGAQINPVRPTTPSAIVTVTQVS